MKNKLMKIGLIVVFLLMSFLIFLFIYSEKTKIIESAKETSGKLVSDITSSTTNEITVIDVTNLNIEKDIEHDCNEYFISKYNETDHWNECTICGKKYNEIAHKFNKVWVGGVATCKEGNYYTNICDCGYSYIGYKSHSWGGYANAKYQHEHARQCSSCGLWDTWYPCSDSRGNPLTCASGGTCATCGVYFSPGAHNLQRNNENDVIYCKICNKEFGTCSNEITRDITKEPAPATYNVINRIRLTNGAKWYSRHQFRNMAGIIDKGAQTVIGETSDISIDLNTEIKFNKNCKSKYDGYNSFYLTVNGVLVQLTVEDIDLYPDPIEPVISSISSENSSLTEWSKTKPIIISGTENYCNSVNVKILDEKANVIFEGDTKVEDNNYSITCTPIIEVGDEEKSFIAIVTDTCDNSISQEFVISKVDCVSPEIISSDKITGEWVKERHFTFTATDSGIGNVSIAFNDENDYKLASKNDINYSREYRFIGDAYEPVKARIFYKDELGNITSQEVSIDKIDNTTPTITNVSMQGSKLVITSNDEKEGLGEGSGVTKYRYLTSKERIENPEVTTENSSEANKDDEIRLSNLNEVKFIYVVAEDAVGNVSEVYELILQDLVLTSNVNLDLVDGKGGVELDWSDYDTTGIYFVIYRKEEGQENFEKIVSLEDKFSNNQYTDILGNDKAKPEAPTVILGTNSNEMQINLSAEDSGTTYTYYVEAYDASTNTILKTSDKKSVKI